MVYLMQRRTTQRGMEKMTNEEALQLMTQAGAYEKGHFLMKSGRHADTFLQCAHLIEHADITGQLCQGLAERCRDCGCDLVIAPALGGIIYGCLLYESDRRLWQIILARAVIMVFVNIMLNTFFLTMLYGPSQAALLPVRALKNAMQFPIDCLLLTAVCRTVQRIPMPAGVR